MNALLATSSRFKFRLLTLLLCLHLAGATGAINCLAMNCEMSAAGGEESNQSSQSKIIQNNENSESCSLKTGECCHHERAQTKKAEAEETARTTAPIEGRQIPAANCCAWQNLPAESVRRVELKTDRQIAHRAEAVGHLTLLGHTSQSQIIKVSTYRPVPLNRGSTHLVNCVFLI